MINDISLPDKGRVYLFDNGFLNTHEDFEDSSQDAIATHLTDDASWIFLRYSVPMQQQTNWCWAATALGIVRYYDPGNTTSQCEVVNMLLDRQDACVDPTNPDVNKPWYLLRTLERFGTLAGLIHGPISPVGLVAQKRNKKPVAVHVRWTNGDGHFVAITGVTEDGRRVCVSDSELGPSTISYIELISAYDKRGHVTESYLTKSRWE